MWGQRIEEQGPTIVIAETLSHSHSVYIYCCLENVTAHENGREWLLNYLGPTESCLENVRMDESDSSIICAPQTVV